MGPWLVVVLVCAVVAVAAVGYLGFYEPPYAGLIADPRRSLVFAHRGFGNHAPDNSLRGAQLALAAGMDGIDIDSQLTADKQLVVFHDLGVDHRTTGHGSVADKTLAEMRALDLGVKFGPGFEGDHVASVEDVLRAYDGQRAIVMIELKVPGTAATGIEQQFVELLEKFHAHEHVYLSSFNPLVLRRLKKLSPKVRTVFIFMDTNWTEEMLEGQDPKANGGRDIPFYLRREPFRRAIRKLVKPDLVSVQRDVAPSTIDRLQARGVPVFLWTLDTEAQIRWGLARRPYGIISNEMVVAKELRDGSRAAAP
ncbi:MAG TPA: glycerophosphodiester phosphodiesterase family protein [Kofleriaceae bacterium]|nr:glycerophosphodiester phosphodiesterase family protein [Kofleriaceae bacterium]